MPAHDAWKACGEPRGPAGIQNIRKRAARLAAHNALATNTPAAAATPVANPTGQAVAQTQTSNGSGSSAARKQPAFRLRPEQVRKLEERHVKIREEYNRLHKAATEEYLEMVRTGKVGKGASSADGVAQKYAAELPDGCTRKITGRGLKNAVLQGRVGVPPAAPGRKAKIPDQFVQAVAELAQMQQLAGNELKPRQLAQAAVASAQGTNWEEHLESTSQRAHFLRRVRMEHNLGVSTSVVIDDRRWKWLTSSNMTQWFAAYKRELYAWGFIPYIPEDIYELIEIALELLPFAG